MQLLRGLGKEERRKRVYQNLHTLIGKRISLTVKVHNGTN